MNRTKIEYLDLTWNPIVGCSGINCEVRAKCWARAMGKRQKHRCVQCYVFRPHFHEERLYQPLHRKKTAIIGTCFMADMFDYEVNPEWLTAIFNVIRSCKYHIFFTLTKQPQNCVDLETLPNPALVNFWLGVSVNKQKDVWRISKLKETNVVVKAVSFEPLYEEINCDLEGIDWVIIGAQTRPTLLPMPKWIDMLVDQADRLQIPVFEKNNLPLGYARQEFPNVVGEQQT